MFFSFLIIDNCVTVSESIYDIKCLFDSKS